MGMASFLLCLAFLPFFFPDFSSAATRNQNCSRTCGGHLVPYPFTFDQSCLGNITLNCSSGAIWIGEFHVRNITPDTILVDASTSCTRPVSAAKALFRDSYYAMTAKNALLLHNCSTNSSAAAPASSSSSSCVIPTGMLTHKDETNTCLAGNKSVTCVYFKYNATTAEDDLLSWGNISVAANGCSTLYSSMAVHSSDDSTSVFDYQIELGWWLKGDCYLCHRNANCVPRNSSRTGNQTIDGVNCICKEGFVGDGFIAGNGCQASPGRSGCKPNKYVPGSCVEKSSKVGLLIAGIICGAVFVIVVAAVFYFIRKHSTLLRSRKCTKRLLSEASCTVPLYPYRCQ